MCFIDFNPIVNNMSNLFLWQFVKILCWGFSLIVYDTKTVPHLVECIKLLLAKNILDTLKNKWKKKSFWSVLSRCECYFNITLSQLSSLWGSGYCDLLLLPFHLENSKWKSFFGHFLYFQSSITLHISVSPTTLPYCKVL